MEAEQVQLHGGETAQESRHLLGVDAELLGAATDAHPRTLDLEIGIDADRHSGPHAQAAARIGDPDRFGL